MRGAHPESAMEQAIERDGIVRRGERILIACSGGADSVALAALLQAVSVPMALHLGIAHVNHGLRPSAWQDECIVLRVGAHFGLPVYVAQLDRIGRGEARLRDARYAALAHLARSGGYGVVASAHHAQDQSETVLLALLRGSGPDGLRGMRSRRELAHGVELARPLLHCSQDDLRAYCHEHALPYAVDPANADPNLRRNAVREALTALRPLFPQLDRAIARAAAIGLDEEAQTPRARLRRKVRAMLRAQPGTMDVDFSHVEAAVRTLERGGSGRFFMKKGVELRIDRGSIDVVTDA